MRLWLWQGYFPPWWNFRFKACFWRPHIYMGVHRANSFRDATAPKMYANCLLSSSRFLYFTLIRDLVDCIVKHRRKITYLNLLSIYMYRTPITKVKGYWIAEFCLHKQGKISVPLKPQNNHLISSYCINAISISNTEIMACPNSR